MSGMVRRGAPWPPAPFSTRATKSSSVAPVASSTLARLSVLGQRGRPFAVTRLDLLKAVGSSPDERARPEGVSPRVWASASSAIQIWLCEKPGVIALLLNAVCADFAGLTEIQASIRPY